MRPGVSALCALLSRAATALSVATAANAAALAGPALPVDASAARHPISPNIYGLNRADPAVATEMVTKPRPPYQADRAGADGRVGGQGFTPVTPFE